MSMSHSIDSNQCNKLFEKCIYNFVLHLYAVDYKKFRNTVKFAKATNELPKTKLLL